MSTSHPELVFWSSHTVRGGLYWPSVNSVSLPPGIGMCENLSWEITGLVLSFRFRLGKDSLDCTEVELLVILRFGLCQQTDLCPRLGGDRREL